MTYKVAAYLRLSKEEYSNEKIKKDKKIEDIKWIIKKKIKKEEQNLLCKIL